MFFWGFLVLTASPAESLLNAQIHSVTFAISITFVIIFCAGVIMLIGERLAYDLALAKEDADRANKAKSQFLANMTHEIRTPLNAVIGMMHLLQTDALTEEQTEYVNCATMASHDLLKIINDILDMSRVEAGKTTLSVQDFDLHELVQNALQPLRHMALEKGLEFSLNIEALPRFVRGDGQRLRQVLINLVGNAIKYTVSGSVSVTGDLEARTGSDHLLPRFKVVDTGIGIPAGQQEFVFGAFNQAETSTEFGGTGLGLAISQRLVRLMGGEIYLQSDPGKGSTFSFTVRFQPSATEAPPAPMGVTSANECKAVPHLLSLRILLVEDDQLNRYFLSKVLTKYGHMVQTADNGRKALEALDETDFDIVLMDVLMPVMDGMETARRVRKRWGAKPPILALTASDSKGDRERFIEAGMDAYLTKPVQVEELLRIISDLAGIEAPQPSNRQAASKAAIPGREHLMRALELMGGNEEDLCDLCTAVLDFLPAQRATLHETLEKGDLQAFIGIAHTLKSTALTFGHEGLASALKKAEKATTRAEAESILGHVEQGLEELSMEIKRYVSD